MAAAVVVLLLLVAQLVLPRIAASVVSGRIGRYGHVISVSVSAWPAIELLWGHAGSVHIHAGKLRLTTSQAAKLAWESRSAGSVEARVDSVRMGKLRVTDVRFSKRGATLRATADMSARAVRAALPEGLSVQLLQSAGGEVEVAASGGLFGLTATVDAVAHASDGQLVVQPRGLLLEDLHLRLFSDHHIRVTGVSAQALGGTGPTGYRVGITALLR